MATGYIKLVLGNLSVVCKQFIGDEFPRKKVEPVKPQNSILGTFVSYGRYYEERHLWQFTTVIKADEQEMLDALYWEHHNLRRTFQPAQVLLIDTTQKFQERSPRSRAIAPAPHDNVKAVGVSHISYYAQFYAWFDAEPIYSSCGPKWVSVRLSFVEFKDKTAP